MTPDGLGYRLEFETPANGKVGPTTVTALDSKTGGVRCTDRANLTEQKQRDSMARRMARKLEVDVDDLQAELERRWNEMQDAYRRHKAQAEAGSPEAAPEVLTELLDCKPDAIRRPLCLIADHAYATGWCPVRQTVGRSVIDGKLVIHKPPLVTDTEQLLVVRDDGKGFANGLAMQGVHPMAELGMPVQLPVSPRPGRDWSGAGVKRYLAGERPDPAEVFHRVQAVVNHFLSFQRCLAPQDTMCELVACYVLVTYLLDAFHVAGYLWPNGGTGSGKSTLLYVVAEMGYLGEVILASSSCATLRDLADYGAVLGFDDAEAVMDIKKCDPDKRTLLLAGSRKGASITVKELTGDRWVTRYVNTFCPRLFSAIRMPDQTLGSRTIVIPMLRSGDPDRTKASILDYATWPCERRRLVDDLWAMGLAHLPELPQHDAQAAKAAELAGRDLEPWRAILAVAHWLQRRHRVKGLFNRLERLSVNYQMERKEFEPANVVPLLAMALMDLLHARHGCTEITFAPGDVDARMQEIAARPEYVGVEALNPVKVGFLLKKLRFRRQATRSRESKLWVATAAEIQDLARAYGVGQGADVV